MVGEAMGVRPGEATAVTRGDNTGLAPAAVTHRFRTLMTNTTCNKSAQVFVIDATCWQVCLGSTECNRYKLVHCSMFDHELGKVGKTLHLMGMMGGDGG